MAHRSLTNECMQCTPASTCQKCPFKLRQDSNTHGRFTTSRSSYLDCP